MSLSLKLRRRPLSLVAGLLFSIGVNAQIPQIPKTVQSPTVAGLGAHGSIPVSLFTGKPEINVNLHTLSDQGITIPIALNYDASGVRPDVHPGWVGLNFNLSTNYAVVRTIKDGPDDSPYFDSRGKLGYFRTSHLLADNTWYTQPDLKAIADNSYLGYDQEPDEFSFNLPDISGKFYMGHDGEFKISCDRPVKVELSSTILTETSPPFIPPSNTHISWSYNSIWRNQMNYRFHAKGFIITDEFGTKYEFGGTNENMEYAIDFFAQGSETWNCNAWFLKSITKNTGQTVDFKYERGAMIAQMYFNLKHTDYRVNNGSFLDSKCRQNPPFFEPYGFIDGKLISPIYLKEISSNNYKVNFISSTSTELRYDEYIFRPYVNWNQAIGPDVGNNKTTDILLYLFPCYFPNRGGSCTDTGQPLAEPLATLQWRKLDTIQIQTPNGTTLKEFIFGYNNVASERLMLQSVREKSGTKLLPPYEFTYFTSLGLSLPPYARSHTDHWGFNNGKRITEPDFAIPNFYSAYGDAFRSPDPDSKYVKLASLTTIKYPTGGITEFTMEPHTYSKNVMLERWKGLDSYTSNKLAGGLRVKEIKSYDPNIAGSEMTKSFSYVSGFNPANPDSVLLSSGILGGQAQYYFPGYRLKPDGNFTYTQNTFSSQSMIPGTENSYGSHIGYSEVVEKSSTGGWTVHKFTNFDNGYLDLQASGSLQPSHTPYQPFNSTAFQRGKLLSEEHYMQDASKKSETIYEYTLVGNPADNSVRAVKSLLTKLCDADSRVYEGTAYVIDVRKFLRSKQVTTAHRSVFPGTFTTSQNYTYWPNGQIRLSVDLFSNGEEVKTVYQYPPHFPNDSVSVAMTEKNMIGTPLSVFTFTGSESAPSPLKEQRVEFALQSGFYLPKKVSSGTGAVLPISLATDIEFQSYDPRGNLLSYTERSGLSTELAYYETSDTGKVDLLKSSSVMDGATAIHTTHYDHKPAVGVQSITDPNSKTSYYAYDEFNRLKSIRNTSATGSLRSSYCYNYAGQAVPCTALAPIGSIAASNLALIAQPDALPVTLVAFTAVKIERTALLNWSTTMETNAESFEVERSTDGKKWIKMVTIDAHGESAELREYTWTDEQPANGENLYRLKMVDRATEGQDQSFAYSQIRSVYFESNGEVVLYPNPITIGEKLNLQIDDLDKISTINIYDTSGKSIIQTKATREINTTNLVPGLYVVQITFVDGSISTYRIVKQ